MKKTALLFSLFVSLVSFAQTQDLYTLAKGDFLGFNAIFDDKDNLFGYVSIYDYGKSGDKTKKFEYAILDKNLNPVANYEFDGDASVGSYVGSVENEKIILNPAKPDHYFMKNKEFFLPSSIVIDLKANAASRKLYYEYQNGIFKEVDFASTQKLKRKDNYESEVFEIKEGGFLVLEYNHFGNYVTNNAIMKFDKDKKEIWKYKYNTNGDKNKKEKLLILNKDSRYIYCLFDTVNKKVSEHYLLVLDMQTGKEISKNPISGLTSDTIENINHYTSSVFGNTLNNNKVFDDKIIMIGKNFGSHYNIEGFAILTINKNNFQPSLKTINNKEIEQFFNDSSKKENINDYYMETKDFFFMNDGSLGILLEKIEINGNSSKSENLIYVYTDRDFKIKGVKVFQKQKTKWIDNYLFSQKINSGEDMVFFYRSYQKDNDTKEKNWNLYINTLIEGKFSQEMIPISDKDNFFVEPYVAKEGYILLQEFNEKEKFNKIRLEKLNY